MWAEYAVNELVFGQEMALPATADLFIFLSSVFRAKKFHVSSMNKVNLFQSYFILVINKN